MTINQLSIFVENKAGTVEKITRSIADAGVSIRALSVADTQEFGILRLIVDKPESAALALKEAGLTVSITNVIAVGIDDVPGAFSVPMRILADAGIGVEYMYAFNGATPHHAYVVLRVDDNERVAELLLKEGIKCITQEQVSEI